MAHDAAALAPDLDAMPARTASPSDVLLDAIYQSALDPHRLARLQDQLLVHFREDRSRDDTPMTQVALSHIRRALRLGASHSAMQRERLRMIEVIDDVAPPVIVFDQHHQVLGMNRHAGSLLGPNHAFGLHEERLVCHTPGALEALMAEADQQSCAWARLAGNGNGSDHGAGLLAYVYRSRTPVNHSAPVAYSLLMIDPGRCITQSIAGLARRMGLTPREVQVTELCLQGLDVDTLCNRTGISPHTLRQHIKNIHAKTGVHNQNALFALVLRNIVLDQASNQLDAKLLPHITGLAHSKVLTLPGGRQLSYAEFGAPSGVPVLYFHSLNASRLELLLHADRLRDLGIRLIAPDRPGYGHSSFTERHDHREYTGDIAALLDELDLDRVSVLSASAGCAHALHAAWALPERIHRVDCTSVVPPIDHILASESSSTLNSLMNRFFRLVPSLLRPSMELMMMGQTVESLLTMMSTDRMHNTFSLTASDIAYITATDNLPYFVASMVESLRQGTRVWAMESALVNQAWTIDLSEITVPVHLWHGTRDGLVPTDMVTRFAEALPECALHVLDDETHLLAFHRIDQLAKAILGAWTADPAH